MRTQNRVSSLTYALVVLFALSLSVSSMGVQGRADVEASPPSVEESGQNDFHSTLQSSFDSTDDSVDLSSLSVLPANSTEILRFLTTNLSVWNGKQVVAVDDAFVRTYCNGSKEVDLFLNLTSVYPKTKMLLIPIDKISLYLPNLAVRSIEFQMEELEGRSFLGLDLPESAGETMLTFSTFSLVIQYWFFYVWNANALLGDHEGDWEMIQLVFADNSRYSAIGSIVPTFAVYSQHYGAQKKAWTDSGVQKEGNHPKVFVANEGHPSKFSPDGENDRWEYPYNFGIAVTCPNPWVNFAGKWGATGGLAPSPNGPVYRVASKLTANPQIWHEPKFFLDKAST